MLSKILITVIFSFSKIFIFIKPSKLTRNCSYLDFLKYHPFHTSNKYGRCYFKIKSYLKTIFEPQIGIYHNLPQPALNSCGVDAYLWTCQTRLSREELLKTRSYKTQFAWDILDIHYISEAPFLTAAYKAIQGGFSSCILPPAFCLMNPVLSVFIEKNFSFWTVLLQNQMKAISVWDTTMSTIFCPKYILYPRWKLKKKCWFFLSSNSNANVCLSFISPVSSLVLCILVYHQPSGKGSTD